MRTEALTVACRPGLEDGARIRVPGKGHVGRNGGENGDLYITCTSSRTRCSAARATICI